MLRLYKCLSFSLSHYEARVLSLMKGQSTFRSSCQQQLVALPSSVVQYTLIRQELQEAILVSGIGDTTPPQTCCHLSYSVSWHYSMFFSTTTVHTALGRAPEEYTKHQLSNI